MARDRNQINIRDVANVAGVSIATVSTFLSGKKGKINLSETTRSRLAKICQEVEYEPNIHARRLFAKESKTIGLVFPSLQEHYEHFRQQNNNVSVDFSLAEMIQGVTLAGTRLGYHINLLPANKSFYEKKEYLKAYRNYSIDGLIIWGIKYDDIYPALLQKNDIPFISVFTKTRDSEEHNYNYVVCDEFAGSCISAQHLIDLGHNNIGYIRGLLTSSVSVDRWNGFRQTLENQGIFDPDLVIDGDFTFHSGKEATKQLLEKSKSISAIACGNDLMAYGVITYLKENGYRVPEDISVTGADLCSFLAGGEITSSGKHVCELAELATEHLVDQITKKDNIPFLIKVKPDFNPGKTSTFKNTNERRSI